MSVVTPPPPILGPRSAGLVLTPEEFDAAEFEPGWTCELINGVFVVSPSPLRQERDPNEELGVWLRVYGRQHPSALDATLTEETLKTTPNRRRVDRAIWCGLGRLPGPSDAPAIVVEFVSAGRRNQARDYAVKRAEYAAFGVREYWIFDRFQLTLTAISFQAEGATSQTISATPGAIYTTPLLPGFELPLQPLFDFANRWEDHPAE